MTDQTPAKSASTVPSSSSSTATQSQSASKSTSQTPSQHKTPHGSTTHRTRQTDSRSSQRKGATNPHRNVHIAQKDQAIWDHFRPRTVQGTKIFIGKNTVIQPGVSIIAEQGTIIIGENNIISEGASIVNKSNTDMVIGNGNVFECNCRIEAIKIGDFNVFGAKCHVMQDATIGTGCVVCPRVMVIQKKRVRDNSVIFGDNMMHEQPLMKKRNRAYIDAMIPVLRTKFKEMKAQPGGGSAGGGSAARSRTARSGPGSARGGSGRGTARATGRTTNPNGPSTVASAPRSGTTRSALGQNYGSAALAKKYGTRSRGETPIKSDASNGSSSTTPANK